ncbi:zinc finger protein 414 isoform X2 [Echeneis naucrates]|uniref:zinc finger protein 414 isoform X2 n=1 Tax=Echeneis naucrates TaxID=173247 RepID=UPI0011145913|nr:zinc finger protein 414 isoform X2 [Echeneis naucrates]
MSSGSTMLHTPDNGNEGNKRISCPLHGCKRVYTDTSSLESHIRDHEIPAQSVCGKVLLCSTAGCSGSFPNMQKLMEHMRQHHKPNIFFLCESCRTKLRSYRGLLTHLHTCSKVPRGKAKTTEPTPLQSSAGTNQSTISTPMDSMSRPQQTAPHFPNQEGSFPAAFPQPDSGVPFLSSPFLSHPDNTDPHLTEGAPQPLLRSGATTLSVNQGVPFSAPDPSDAQTENQSKSTEPVQSGPGPAPHALLGSSAVWKKSQGMTCNRRILWEHTKGRYRCVQCGHTTTNRKEMTQHVSIHHSTNKAAEDAASSAL